MNTNHLGLDSIHSTCISSASKCKKWSDKIKKENEKTWLIIKGNKKKILKDKGGKEKIEHSIIERQGNESPYPK